MDFNNINYRQQVYNIRDYNGTNIPQVTMRDFVNILENSMSDICDLLFKQSLSDVPNTIPYVVTGGKATNEIISAKYLKKSFDYDIHVGNPAHIEAIGNHIADYMNAELNRYYKTPIRKHIYNILLARNIVDASVQPYYMGSYNANLFYFGYRRVDATLQIPGIFLRLVLRRNIFGDNTSYSNYPTSQNIAEVYLPISDIAEDDVNFGLETMRNIMRYGRSDVPYANYPYIIFNTIRYILASIGTNPVKLQRNLNKLRLLSIPNLYSCNYTTSNNVNRTNNMITLANQQLDNVGNRINTINVAIPQNLTDVKIGNERIFQAGADIQEIIRNFGRAYSAMLNNPNIHNTLCNTTTIYNTPARPRDTIFRTLAQNNNYLELLEQVAYASDFAISDQRYMYRYTELLYRIINTYCWLNSLNIDILQGYTELGNYTGNVINVNRRLANNTNVNITTNNVPPPVLRIPLAGATDAEKTASNAQLENICVILDNVMEDTHRNYGVAPNDVAFNDIKDMFMVYSLQNLYNISNPADASINISNIKNGDVFHIPQYVSTSYSKNYGYDFFAGAMLNPVIFKIEIDKRNANWILINNYSNAPGECEILIKRNQYYVIQNIEYETIEIETHIEEVQVITLKLHATIANATAYSRQIRTRFPITSDYRFKKACIYAYINYLSKPYAGTYDNTELNLFGINRPNHALAHSIRKASYIPIISAYRRLAYLNNVRQDIHGGHAYDFTYDDILRVCIASVFGVTGRNSEGGFATAHYQDYLRNSGTAFYTFAQTLPDLFSVAQRDMFRDLIRTYRTQVNSPYAWLMTISHDLEMPRVNRQPLLDLNTYLQPGNKLIIETMCENALINNGNRIMNRLGTNQYVDFNDTLFYRSNTDINFCLKQINQALYADNTAIGLPGNQGSVALPATYRPMLYDNLYNLLDNFTPEPVMGGGSSGGDIKIDNEPLEITYIEQRNNIIFTNDTKAKDVYDFQIQPFNMVIDVIRKGTDKKTHDDGYFKYLTMYYSSQYEDASTQRRMKKEVGQFSDLLKTDIVQTPTQQYAKPTQLETRGDRPMGKYSGEQLIQAGGRKLRYTLK